MVEVARIEWALLAFISTMTAHEGELGLFGWMGEDWSRVGEFNVLFAYDLEYGFAGEGLGAGWCLCGFARVTG